jgi:hypothetical protein
MNYEPEIIRARFVEAAFTERYLPSANVPSAKGFWPVFVRDAEDYKGYDDQAWIDNAARKEGRASIGAVSRHQECLDWSRTIVTHELRRHILWSWAFCRANGWDFGSRCKRKGWARPTAYRHRDAAIEAILHESRKKRLFVRLPDDKWLRHETPIQAIDSIRSSCSDETPQAVKFTPGYRTEPSRDTLDTPEAVADFAKALERRNARMRKLQAWRNEGVA